MAKFLSLALAVALVLNSSGCGLILGYGGLQPVQVTTNPEGAELIADGVPQEQRAPTQVMLHPKTEHTITARTEDGKTGATHIGKTVRIDVVVLDAVLTLGIGLLVDYMSGSLYKLRSPVNINLGTAPPPTAGVTATPAAGTGTAAPAADAAPCPICNEPRGDVSPCPHCGMD